MMRNLLFAAFALAVVVGIGYANQLPASKVVISVGRTSANSGKQMYVSYCAPCHGVDGRGQGPVASALIQRPTNLALLSKNNGGKFPATHILAVLKFGAENPAHGTAEMPVWGPMLGKMDPAGTGPNIGVLRIANLSEYLQSLQEK